MGPTGKNSVQFKKHSAETPPCPRALGPTWPAGTLRRGGVQGQGSWEETAQQALPPPHAVTGRKEQKSHLKRPECVCQA